MTEKQKKILFISGETIVLSVVSGLIVTAVYRFMKNRNKINSMTLPLNRSFRNWKGGNIYLKNSPIGIRNNNPGNLVHTSIKWQGKVPKPNNAGRFEMFTSPEYGVRAMIKDLTSKIESHKNIEAIVSRYAPAFENNTRAYINVVAKALNVSSTATLLPTKNTLKLLVISMAKHETGGNYITNELFEKAYRIS